MPTAYIPLEFKKGSNWKKTFTWKVKSTGVPVDLTGYTARMSLRKTADENGTLYDTFVSGGVITLGGVAGTIALNVPNTTTDDYTFKRAYYDLLLVSSGSEMTYLIEGVITVKSRVTKPS